MATFCHLFHEIRLSIKRDINDFVSHRHMGLNTMSEQDAKNANLFVMYANKGKI
jgi:hypothetical protein